VGFRDGLGNGNAEAALRAPSKNLSQLRLLTVAAVAFIALVVCVLPAFPSIFSFTFLFFFALSFQKHCPTNI